MLLFMYVHKCYMEIARNYTVIHVAIMHAFTPILNSVCRTMAATYFGTKRKPNLDPYWDANDRRVKV